MENLIQSYVKRRWCVSTAQRESSAAAAYGALYYETLVWVWDAEKRERGDLTDTHFSGSSEEYALSEHAEICAELARL